MKESPFLGQLELSRLHPQFQNVCSHFTLTKSSPGYLTCVSPFYFPGEYLNQVKQAIDGTQFAVCCTSSSLLHALLPGCQGEQVRRGVCYSCLVMSWINGADSSGSLLNKLLWVHQSEGLKASANGNQSGCKWTVLCKLKLSVDGWIRTCKAGLVLVLIGLVKHICCSDFLRCH